MERRIDYDRGVMIKTDAKTGVDVYMYFDTPGIYLSAHGTEVSEGLAKAAGYDTVRWGKEKVKQDRMSQAAQLIEQEMELAESNAVTEVLQERDGFKLVHIGFGRHVVRDPDDQTLTLAMPKEQANHIFKMLAPIKGEKGDDPKVPLGKQAK